MTQFTGNRDVDYDIMMRLDDRDLLNFCQTDQYVSKLCRNDDFWKRRYKSRFGGVSRPIKTTWRNFYLQKLVSGSYSYNDNINRITADITIMKDSPMFIDVYERTKNFILAEKRRLLQLPKTDEEVEALEDIFEDVILKELGRLIFRLGIEGAAEHIDNYRGYI